MRALDLNNPKDCRIYCEQFEVPGKGHVESVQLSSGREVHLKNMTDEDAVLVAKGLYEIEKEAAQSEKRRLTRRGGLIQ